MNETFSQHVESLHPKLEQLLLAKPFTFAQLAAQPNLPERGIYLFSEAGRHLYVGRSNNIRKRLQWHCRPSSTHNQASFAFLLAREFCDVPRASYRREGSREHLMTQSAFSEAFIAQKARLRTMSIYAVAEEVPIRQALLEMYVSISLATPYNDFDTH